jgi:hypothetical protein
MSTFNKIRDRIDRLVQELDDALSDLTDAYDEEVDKAFAKGKQEGIEEAGG